MGEQKVEIGVINSVKNEDGSLKNFMLKAAGRHFSCPCGCNCFHKPDDKDLNLFKCNGCGIEYR